MTVTWEKTESENEFQKRIRENKIFDTRNVKTYPQLLTKLNTVFRSSTTQPNRKQIELACDELDIKPTRYVKTYDGKRYGTQPTTYKDKTVYTITHSVKGKKRKVKRDIKTGRFIKWVD